MLINLLAWIYITFICLAWGNMTWQGLSKLLSAQGGEDAIEMPLACLAGLCVAGCIVMYASLFFPVNGAVHAVILAPAIIYYFYPANRKRTAAQWRKSFARFSLPGYALFGASLLVILATSSYRIHHPDTLLYHAQIIKWMESYRAIPGLAQLKNEFGLQGMWFALQALFRFNFVHPNDLLIVNGCVVGWLALFVTGKIMQYRNGDTRDTGMRMEWLLFFAFLWISWSQIRLTAASASPDFIVAIFCWASFYSFLKGWHGGLPSQRYLLLAILFASAAAATKLSGMYMLLLAIVILFTCMLRQRWKLAVTGACIGLVILLPLLARNVISSGYLLYPSHFPDVVNRDWKLPGARLSEFERYITAYARLAVDSKADVESVLQMPLSAWAPLWWQHLGLADKCLIALLAGLFVLDLIFIRDLIRSLKGPWLAMYAVALTAVVIWFIKAPDPRFATGYLVILLYIQYRPLAKSFSLYSGKYIPALASAMQYGLIIALLAYSGYRLVRFFKKENLLFPAGIEKAGYSEEKCHGTIIYRPLNDQATGFTPEPCFPYGCDTVTWRGSHITSGFR